MIFKNTSPRKFSSKPLRRNRLKEIFRAFLRILCTAYHIFYLGTTKADYMYHFSIQNMRKTTLFVASVCLLGVMDVQAAEIAGTAFDSLYETLNAWATGSLGKSLALVFLLVGLGLGVIRGSIIGAITCIAAALSLMIAPTIIRAIFTGGVGG